MEEKLKFIPRFNDHGSGCKGHGNSMLDCEYREKSDRKNLTACISNYLK